MKPLLAAAAVASVIAGVFFVETSYAGSWRAGTPTMVEESEMSDLLEQTYDWAYCTGIPRFGQKGEFPYEMFVVFECSTKRDGMYCSDYRVKAIKAKQRGWFKLKFINGYGECY